MRPRSGPSKREQLRTKENTFSPAELSSRRREMEVLADSKQPTVPPSTKHVSCCAARVRRREKMAAKGTSSTTGRSLLQSVLVSGESAVDSCHRRRASSSVTIYHCRRASSSVTIDLQACLLELVHPGAPPVASLFFRSHRSLPSPPSPFQSGPSSSLEAGDVATPIWARRLTIIVQSQQHKLQKAREETTGSGSGR